MANETLNTAQLRKYTRIFRQAPGHRNIFLSCEIFVPTGEVHTAYGDSQKTNPFQSDVLGDNYGGEWPKDRVAQTHGRRGKDSIHYPRRGSAVLAPSDSDESAQLVFVACRSATSHH